MHGRYTFLSPQPLPVGDALPSLGGAGGGSPWAGGGSYFPQSPPVGVVLPSLGGVGGGSYFPQSLPVGVVLPSLGGVGGGSPWVGGGFFSLFLFRRYLFLF